MRLEIIKTEPKAVAHFRNLFLHEGNFQFISNAFHERGWSDCYLIHINDTAIGYGATCGRGNWATERSSIFEFYLIPSHRSFASFIFPELIKISGVQFIECQTNDLLLASMLFEFTENSKAETILFEDHHATSYSLPGSVFRLQKNDDKIFVAPSVPLRKRCYRLSGVALQLKFFKNTKIYLQ